MPASTVRPSGAGSPSRAAERPLIVVGITDPAAAHVLHGRLRILREAGFRVVMVSSPGELLDRTAEREGVEAIALPMHREIAPFSDLVSLFRLWRLLRRLKPDLVEFSTPKAGLLGTLAARLCGVPRRIYMLRGLKLETTTGLKRRILLAAERLAGASAHVVICNSNSLRAEAIALGVAPAAKMLVLGAGSSNGVDMELFSPGQSDVRARYGVPADAHVIGFVGRVTRDKGVPELIEAFDTVLKSDPRAHLLIVGWFDAAEDLLGKDVRRRIESHPQIHLTGYAEVTAPFYRAMDVMVLPTWREGFPTAVLEASSTGVPVITTICTGSRDSVVPEVTGLLIPPGYPEAISEAVLKLLGDPERRVRMGQAGRAWVREHFVEEQVLRLTADYYTELLKPKVAGRVGEEAY